MKKNTKDRLAVICLLVALAVVAGGFAWIANSRDAWLVKSMVDRVAPWETPEDCYAKTPDAQSYFDSYDDAAGAYENYVYELDAVDAAGGHRRVVLVSFGTMLEGNGWLKMTANGTSVHAWEYVDANDVPESARENAA